jgi:hypothetical protein
VSAVYYIVNGQKVGPDGEAIEGDDLDGKTVEELQSLADERGVAVQGTGKDGRVLKSDLVAALGA